MWDDTFGVGGIAYSVLVAGCPLDSMAFDMTVLPSGKILVAGRGASGGMYSGLIARYDEDGSLDTSFNSKGYSLLAVQNDSGSSDMMVQFL